MRRKLNQSSGQTLVEVLIATGIIILILTSFTAGISYSVRTTRVSRDELLAKEYVREPLETMRRFRSEMGWSAFVVALRDDANGDGEVTYCMTAIPSSKDEFIALTSEQCLSTQVIPSTLFRRSLSVVISSNNKQVDMKSSVDWEDGNNAFDSTSTLVLKEEL